MGVAREDSTGAGGETSKSESISKGLAEAKRECVIGGGSRRRLCCVCVLGMLGGRAKIEGGNRHGDERGRPSDKGNIAYASVIALRLREHKRCTYFSCRARFGVFIGLVCVPLRLLAQGKHNGCGSRASVILGAREGALSLLEQVSRKDCGSCSSGFIGQSTIFSA